MFNNIFVYKKIKSDSNSLLDDDLTLSNLKEYFEVLLNKLRLIRAPFSYELFPQVAINIKWKFDYLTNIRANPLLLIKDLIYWHEQAEMFIKFQEEEWINSKDINTNFQKINNIEAYNFMWTKNLSMKENFNISKKIAELRVNQIYELFKSKFNIDPFYQNLILDSGCGPGRYVDAISKFDPKKIIGLDSGKDIIKKNKENFQNKKISFIHGNSINLPFKDNEFDFVLSAGVLHHLNMPIEKTIPEHSRVLKDNGLFFIFLAGESGIELNVWDFCHKLLNSIPIEMVHNRYNNSINHLRLQGILDHGFSSYFHTNRDKFESLLNMNFNKIERVPGVQGIDVTMELFKDDRFFEQRFGSGNLRYICKK